MGIVIWREGIEKQVPFIRPQPENIVHGKIEYIVPRKSNMVNK